MQKIITVKGRDQLLGSVIVTTGASRALNGQADAARTLLAAHRRMIALGLSASSQPEQHRSGIGDFTIDTLAGSTILMTDDEAKKFLPIYC